MRKSLFFLVFGGVFLLDFLSKQYALGHQDMFIWNSQMGIELSLQYVENRGVAWGMFAEYYPYLLIFRIGAIAALLLYLYFAKMARPRIVFLSLLTAGAACNVLDCLVHGYVIDMIHFTFWGHSYGIFNVADAAIFLGVFGLMFKEKKKPCLARGPSK